MNKQKTMTNEVMADCPSAACCPSSEMLAKIHAWESVKARRGNPTCPCGFKGGTRNIVAHRLACDVWAVMCRKARWFTENANVDLPDTAAIAALMIIEERYIDGCDTYEDWKFMGDTARIFLSENAKGDVPGAIETP